MHQQQLIIVVDDMLKKMVCNEVEHYMTAMSLTGLCCVAASYLELSDSGLALSELLEALLLLQHGLRLTLRLTLQLDQRVGPALRLGEEAGAALGAGPLHLLALLVGRLALHALEAAQRRREVVGEPLALQFPLALRGRGERRRQQVQVLAAAVGVLGQLVSVMLDLVAVGATGGVSHWWTCHISATSKRAHMIQFIQFIGAYVCQYQQCDVLGNKQL